MAAGAVYLGVCEGAWALGGIAKAGTGMARRISEHMQVAGLGQISEILDAEAPHQPRGCIAQAWSVAELLRSAVEDVFEMKPVRAISAAAAQAA